MYIGLVNYSQQPPVAERELGVRSARQQLPALLSLVEAGDHVVYLTRNGERVAALVHVSFADGVLASQGEDAPIVPGDLAGAVRLVEYLLCDGEPNSPDPAAIRTVPQELVGGFMTLVDVLLSGAILNFGIIPIITKEGPVENRYVADLVLHRLYEHSKSGNVDPSVLPILAGCLWAAQVNESAVNFRSTILAGVTPREAVAWIYSLEALCCLMNEWHGPGTAEAVMYEIEEGFREGKIDLRPDNTDSPLV